MRRHMDHILDLLIRDDLDILAVHIINLCHPYTNILYDTPKFPDTDHVSHLDVSLHQKEHAGNDIPHKAVSPDTDDHGNNPGRCQQG